MIGNEIRMVKTSEHAEVLKLWENSVRASHDFITETDIEDYRLLISNSLWGMEVFCVENANQMQGFIALADRKVQLLFVRPDVFGQGIGKKLMHFAIQHWQAWMVDVNAQNKRAVMFYLSLGFEIHEKFPVDGAGKPYPVWSLKLPEHMANHNTWKSWKKWLYFNFKSTV